MKNTLMRILSLLLLVFILTGCAYTDTGGETGNETYINDGDDLFMDPSVKEYLESGYVTHAVRNDDGTVKTDETGNVVLTKTPTEGTEIKDTVYYVINIMKNNGWPKNAIKQAVRFLYIYRSDLLQIDVREAAEKICACFQKNKEQDEGLGERIEKEFGLVTVNLKEKLEKEIKMTVNEKIRYCEVKTDKVTLSEKEEDLLILDYLDAYKDYECNVEGYLRNIIRELRDRGAASANICAAEYLFAQVIYPSEYDADWLYSIAEIFSSSLPNIETLALEVSGRFGLDIYSDAYFVRLYEYAFIEYGEKYEEDN